MEVIPRDQWTRVTYLLIEHGRAICVARRPKCAQCTLQDICPAAVMV